MPYFIVLKDREGVLGVWTTRDRVVATRWGLQMSLTYPGCGVTVRRAPSLQALIATDRDPKLEVRRVESLDDEGAPLTPVPSSSSESRWFGANSLNRNR
ncbi:MAG: hypothetical protein HC923_13100 [Myxococcales bacterium]|nr:hypothetical protein [Myxococcales bacterium]